jgi:hypothetical protein
MAYANFEEKYDNDCNAVSIRDAHQASPAEAPRAGRGKLLMKPGEARPGLLVGLVDSESLKFMDPDGLVGQVLEYVGQ